MFGDIGNSLALPEINLMNRITTIIHRPETIGEGIGLQGDPFEAEGFANRPCFALKLDATLLGDFAHKGLCRIEQLRQAGGVRADAGNIAAGGDFERQCVVGALGVVELPPAVEMLLPLAQRIGLNA